MYLVQYAAGLNDWAPARNGCELAIYATEAEAKADVAWRKAEFDRAFPDGHSARHRIVEMPAD